MYAVKFILSALLILFPVGGREGSCDVDGLDGCEDTTSGHTNSEINNHAGRARAGGYAPSPLQGSIIVTILGVCMYVRL